jgi:molybdate/tungstate transport system ATP-binding protein
MIKVESLYIKQETFVLNNISFNIDSGNYTVLKGGTATGKTTLLEVISGLRSFEKGKIYLNGDDVSNLNPALRNIGYVPQDILLFDSMNVYDNIAFALKIRGYGKDVINKKVVQLADEMGIKDILKRSTEDLSGGEKQRVALARAMSFEPKVFLLDEPLSALDKNTHTEICELIKRVLKSRHATVLHVTHNESEVLALADVVLEMADGAVKPLT